MKHNNSFRCNSTAIFCIVALLLPILITSLAAQGFGANVRVNHVSNGDQDTDGGVAVAVYGNTVYARWQDWDSYITYISTSTDGGSTFGDGVTIAAEGPQLFGSITVDDTGNLYVVWDGADMAEEMINGVYMARSTDEGQTFSQPDTLSDTGIFPKIAIRGNNVYVLFQKADANNNTECFFMRSTNGGTSFEEPYRISDADQHVARWEDLNALYIDAAGTIYAAWNDGRRADGGVDIYLSKSINNGVIFGPNVPVNDITGPDANALQFSPSLAAYGSNVYVVWREEPTDDYIRLKFAVSSNGGASFGPEMLIDQGMCKTPSLALNDAGEIYLAYTNNRTEGNGLYCVKSRDSGQSFEAIEYISDASSDASYPSINVRNDIVYAVWTDNRVGQDDKDVFFAKGGVVIAGIDPNLNIASRFSLSQNYPNPFNPQTTIRFALPQSAAVTLTITNSLGQVVKSAYASRILQSGEYTYLWDGRGQNGETMPTGVYFYTILAGEFSATREMILLK